MRTLASSAWSRWRCVRYFSGSSLTPSIRSKLPRLAPRRSAAFCAALPYEWSPAPIAKPVTPASAICMASSLPSTSFPLRSCSPRYWTVWPHASPKPSRPPAENACLTAPRMASFPLPPASSRTKVRSPARPIFFSTGSSNTSDRTSAAVSTATFAPTLQPLSSSSSDASLQLLPAAIAPIAASPPTPPVAADMAIWIACCATCSPRDRASALAAPAIPPSPKPLVTLVFTFDIMSRFALNIRCDAS